MSRAARFPLVVFDWDGTLANSEDHIVASVLHAIEAMGLPDRTREQIRETIGLSMFEATQALYPGRGEEMHTRFIEFFRTHRRGDSEAVTELFPGVPETLQALRETGRRLAIATGKSRSGLERELNQLGLSVMFDAARCADQAASKPDPQMLNELMAELGYRPEETLMVGDTSFDLQMALAAGAGGVAVTTGVHSRARLLEFEPLAVLERIAELPPWLDTTVSGSAP